VFAYKKKRKEKWRNEAATLAVGALPRGCGSMQQRCAGPQKFGQPSANPPSDLFCVMFWVSLPFIGLYHSPVYVSTCELFSLMDQLT
jgi:hypothetical protein